MKRTIATLLLAATSLCARAEPPKTSPALTLPKNQPKILLGVDAQSPATFDKVVAIGANCLIRYDNGPQKNITLDQWMNEARQKRLFYIVQGTRLFSDQHKAKFPDPYLLAIAQDDEPDLNRAASGDAELFYTAKDAPHPGATGWTRPQILEDRYKAWKKAAPNVPIIVNFAGQAIGNPWYTHGSFHKPYIAATDWMSFDWYVRNNNATRYSINFIGMTFDRLALWGPDKPQFAYIECSDQVLDGDPQGGVGRGPTPAETQAEIWHALAHGAKGVWLFPQRIGRGFDYWAITEENEKAIKETFATINKYETLLADGTREFKEEFPTDPKNGKWPGWEECTWTSKDGKQKLTVRIDLTGEEAPKLTPPGGAAATPAATPRGRTTPFTGR